MENTHKLKSTKRLGQSAWPIKDPIATILCVLLLLSAIFVPLKALGLVPWSWWLVWAPLWIIPAITLAYVVGIMLYFALAETKDSKRTY